MRRAHRLKMLCSTRPSFRFSAHPYRAPTRMAAQDCPFSRPSSARARIFAPSHGKDRPVPYMRMYGTPMLVDTGDWSLGRRAAVGARIVNLAPGMPRRSLRLPRRTLILANRPSVAERNVATVPLQPTSHLHPRDPATIDHPPARREPAPVRGPERAEVCAHGGTRPPLEESALRVARNRARRLAVAGACAHLCSRPRAVASRGVVRADHRMHVQPLKPCPDARCPCHALHVC
jgi:hypothetical protein